MSSAKASTASDTGQWLGRTRCGWGLLLRSRKTWIIARRHPSECEPGVAGYRLCFCSGPAVWTSCLASAFPRCFSGQCDDVGLGAVLARYRSRQHTRGGSAWLCCDWWSEGAATFESPAGVARFAVISLLVATPISATIGVGSLWVLGQTTTASFGTVWTTWWLGDLGGALVVTPALVLWFRHKSTARDVWNFAPLYAAAGLVGLLAFSPIVAHPMRDLLPFLAIVPLLWAALRQGPRDTATVALILSVFAVWGTLEAEGPFARVGLNEIFLTHARLCKQRGVAEPYSER